MKLLNILYILFFSINALAATLVAALTGANWQTYSGTEKFVVCCAVMNGWTTTMIALMTKLAARESMGKPLIPSDDTTFTTKPQTKP